MRVEGEAVMEDMSESEGRVEGGGFHPHTHKWRGREMRRNQTESLRRALAADEKGTDRLGALVGEEISVGWFASLLKCRGRRVVDRRQRVEEGRGSGKAGGGAPCLTGGLGFGLSKPG
jgi:hypothetical protein